MKINEFLLKMFKVGQFSVDEKGCIVYTGIYNVLIPAHVIATLIKKVNKKILFELGRLHAERGLELYKKIYKFPIIGLEKIADFGLQIFSTLGWGIIRKEVVTKPNMIVISNPSNPVAKSYLKLYGKASKPIDSYLCGYFYGGIKGLTKKEIEVKEIKCIACGDQACVFVIKAKKGKRIFG